MPHSASLCLSKTKLARSGMLSGSPLYAKLLYGNRTTHAKERSERWRDSVVKLEFLAGKQYKGIAIATDTRVCLPRIDEEARYADKRRRLFSRATIIEFHPR